VIPRGSRRRLKRQSFCSCCWKGRTSVTASQVVVSLSMLMPVFDPPPGPHPDPGDDCSPRGAAPTGGAQAHARATAKVTGPSLVSLQLFSRPCSPNASRCSPWGLAAESVGSSDTFVLGLRASASFVSLLTTSFHACGLAVQCPLPMNGRTKLPPRSEEEVERSRQVGAGAGRESESEQPPRMPGRVEQGPGGDHCCYGGGAPLGHLVAKLEARACGCMRLPPLKRQVHSVCYVSSEVVFLVIRKGLLALP